MSIIPLAVLAVGLLGDMYHDEPRSEPLARQNLLLSSHGIVRLLAFRCKDMSVSRSKNIYQKVCDGGQCCELMRSRKAGARSVIGPSKGTHITSFRMQRSCKYGGYKSTGHRALNTFIQNW